MDLVTAIVITAALMGIGWVLIRAVLPAEDPSEEGRMRRPSWVPELRPGVVRPALAVAAVTVAGLATTALPFLPPWIPGVVLGSGYVVAAGLLVARAVAGAGATAGTAEIRDRFEAIVAPLRDELRT